MQERFSDRARHAMALANRDKTITLWDLGARELRSILRGHTLAVDAIAFAPDEDEAGWSPEIFVPNSERAQPALRMSKGRGPSQIVEGWNDTGIGVVSLGGREMW